MGNSISSNWMKFYDENILAFFQSLKDNPFSLFTTILYLEIVIFLLYAFFRMVKGSRAWQLIKGIAFLIIATWISGLLNLNILNSILTGIMNWGVIALVVIFQPELRRGLEQLGTNKLTKFFIPIQLCVPLIRFQLKKELGIVPKISGPARANV